MIKIALTSGDFDGVGPEIVTKALSKIRPKKDVQFILWRSHRFPKKYLRHIDRHFNRLTVPTWAATQKVDYDYHRTLVDIESYSPPAKWVEEMGRAGNQHSIDALVTAPLSKTGIVQAGMKDIGHTEILRRTTKSQNVFMTFLGQKFNVVLLTGHTAIRKAYDKISSELLEDCVRNVVGALELLPASRRNKPIGLVGLSPHAGEGGVIDKKEAEIYYPLVKKLRKMKVNISDPLVPDVCFQEKYWNKYSFYIASYHDQGLIPFKMVHSAMPGVQLSLGLPFVRTSVAHGTAKDIFGKNKADETSMVNAINVAIKLIKSKPVKW